jgi:hypothetical protein
MGILFPQHLFIVSDAGTVLKYSPSTMTRTLGKMLPLLVEAATKIFIDPIDSQANKC